MTFIYREPGGLTTLRRRNDNQRVLKGGGTRPNLLNVLDDDTARKRLYALLLRQVDDRAVEKDIRLIRGVPADFKDGRFAPQPPIDAIYVACPTAKHDIGRHLRFGGS